ncbi:MAG: hypothetical protein H6574_20055 [Lewinellaceae bacterium]|nr:hypothetical protein [Lewinellaceae bacterium]
MLHHAVPDTLPYLTFDAPLLEAMYEQASYLRRKDVKEYPVYGISKAEMLKTVELLQDCQILQPEALLDRFDFYKVKTDLKRQNPDYGLLYADDRSQPGTYFRIFSAHFAPAR